MNIGIFRALDVRFNHIDFAASFEEFNAQFIANLTPDMNAYLKKLQIKFHDLSLTPKYILDPIYPLIKKTDFTPWLQFDPGKLYEISKDINFYEVYEPYFFYSSQIANTAHKNQRPLITEIWTSFPEHPSLYLPPYKQVVQNVIEKTDLFVFRTERARNYLKHFKISEQKKAVIYQGVNIEKFSDKKRKHEGITILFVGALASHKGLDDLLAIFPELVNKFPEKLRLVICGEGPLRAEIIKLSQQLPVEYKGFISHNDLPALYQSADIYCQPSKDYYVLGIKGGEEFAGYTFMEAMASGLPIVTTYCGGIPEIVGEDNLLIDQANKEQLFHSLRELIEDRSKRESIGKNNRQQAENRFDILKQTKKLEAIIKQKLT